MRKFVVADLHGNGDVYDSIMGYLTNISKDEEVELYINGDLIDRGQDSFMMFVDVKNRVLGEGDIKVHYLGGNHELMMYQALLKRKPNRNVSKFNDWIRNGGYYLNDDISFHENGEELYEEFKNFVGNLKIYHVFDETLEDKKMLLVHAQAPIAAHDNIDMRIRDNTFNVSKAVWTRKGEMDPILSMIGRTLGFERVGLDDFFTIIGHTPVDNKNGFFIDKKENYINIDGGCAAYAYGYFTYDHVPLLEVKDGCVEILVFDHDNHIKSGFIYDGELKSLNDDDLEERRSYIDSQYNDQAVVYRKRISAKY